MYLTAEKITVESDEMGFELHIEGDTGPLHPLVINIQGIDLDAFYDQVRARIGPYLREKEEAHTEFVRVVNTGSGVQAFVCSSEDVDESGGYDRSDPKHSDWHSVHADHYDNHEKV